MNRPSSVFIIGGGLIGCSIAFELLKQGIPTTILDKGALLSEASTAAAGMLGAQVETHSPGPFYELCKASQRLAADWAEELHAVSGVSPQYIPNGILRVAASEEDERELRSRLPWMSGAEWVPAAQVRQLEPAVSDRVTGGIYFAQDHQVHPLHTAAALRSALRKLGCVIKEWTPALRLITEGSRVVGVKTSAGDFYADHVVLAAGAWSPSLLEPLPVSLPMFPVKGQCLSVRTETAIVTSTVFTKGCYVVPRLDGTLTIGATQEQAGYDKRTTVAGIGDLFRRAVDLLPELEAAEFVTTWAGLRPGTPDSLPYIGQHSSASGLTFATGHFRNGILLAPVTARIVSRLIAGLPEEIDIAAYSPNRTATA